ncbi:MAG: hypothetical protein HW416_3843, partial [Chloroflexi bacterium]|nr:hypothetical protein [Chloroflexota bacterium]
TPQRGTRLRGGRGCPSRRHPPVRASSTQVSDGARVARAYSRGLAGLVPRANFDPVNFSRDNVIRVADALHGEEPPSV